MSNEHEFLAATFNGTLKEFAALRLYGIAESERRKFDLSCIIDRDWSRPLVGQGAWGNARGLDKDLRTLILDTDSEIKVYIARNSVPYRRTITEILGDYGRSEHFNDLFRLRVFWIPNDFTAANEEDRATVGALLKEQVVSDLLMNIVFGNLSARDLRLFVVSGGILGLGVAILHYIAVQGFTNTSVMIRDLRLRSSGPAREKLIWLQSLGFIAAPDMAAYYERTVKGKVMLELFRRLHEEVQFGVLSAEMSLSS